MANASTNSVVSIWRYPVKSMMGEELNASEVTERGLLGDRVYALLDPATGKVVSAKNPPKWSKMFDFRASFVSPPVPGRAPRVRITLPNGTIVLSDQPDLNAVMSTALGREVRLVTSAPEKPSLEEYWPNVEGLAHRDKVTDEGMPPHTFFDAATVHVMTTATIDGLRALYPEGRFEVRRFRPNIVIRTSVEEAGFVENEWVGRRLAIGESVRLRITAPCSRCVMTTLPQGDLPQDGGILRTAAKHNKTNVGVYAVVEHDGGLRRGDPVALI